MAEAAAAAEEPEERRIERAAVVGLALSSLPNEDDLRVRLAGEDKTTFPSLGESLEHLDELTRKDKRLTHRTVGLRLLAKLASRRGTEPLQHEAGPVRGFLRTSVERSHQECAVLDDHSYSQAARGDPPLHPALADADIAAPISDGDPEVQRMLDGLEGAAQRRAPSWGSFAPTAVTSLALSDEELGLPRCSDEEDVPVCGVDSTRIVTWFASPKPASAFLPWTDVRTWPIKCSLFYESITTTAEIAPDATTYSEMFMEKVRISEDKVMCTPLRFTRTVAGPNLHTLYFAMERGEQTKDLYVDTGSLIVRQDACNPPGRQTQLFAEKCLRFTDPALREWPTLLCDLYWMELTILAAEGCKLPPSDTEET